MKSTESTILIADSNRSNLALLSQQLGQAGYETLTAASLEELDHFAEKASAALQCPGEACYVTSHRIPPMMSSIMPMIREILPPTLQACSQGRSGS